ncbi:MAG TPA: DUF86 domain-containing protein [Bryobacteraceae bacterium]|nr:DUF86 domain-containing protein [Bryobacteraceae bacterium]
MSIRRDSSFLEDVLEAAGKIESIIAATSENSFIADQVLQAAVLHHLTVIGEAVNRLSPEVRDNHPEVPWRQLVSVRNRIVHAYFDLDWKILWIAATEDVPALRIQISAILQSHFPE